MHFYFVRCYQNAGKLAKTIIDSGNLALSAKKHIDDYGAGQKVEVALLGIKNK